MRPFTLAFAWASSAPAELAGRRQPICLSVSAPAEVSAFADIGLAAAESAASYLRLLRAEADLRRLLVDPDIAAVAVCSATDTQADIGAAAARAAVDRDGRVPVLMGLAAGKSHAEHRPVALSEVAGHEGLDLHRGTGAKRQGGFTLSARAEFTSGDRSLSLKAGTVPGSSY